MTESTESTAERLEALHQQLSECVRLLRDDLYRLRDPMNDEAATGGRYDCRTKWVYVNPSGHRFVVFEILHDRWLTGAILDKAGEALATTTDADVQWLDKRLP